MRRIVLIVHSVRSAHNAGSLFRTADGLGVEHVYLSGYTPYPEAKDDQRLPHVRLRAAKQIQKTALGAEASVAWTHIEDLAELFKDLRAKGFIIAALEQDSSSINLPDFQTDKDVALVVGSEVNGLEPSTLSAVDLIIEIPMLGQKESYNVANAAAIALYHLRYTA